MGPKEANPLWTHIAADYLGHITWTYSRLKIDTEGTAEKCNEKGL